MSHSSTHQLWHMTLMLQVLTIGCLNWPLPLFPQGGPTSWSIIQEWGKLVFWAHSTLGAIILILNPISVLWKLWYEGGFPMPVLPNSCVICSLALNSQTMATESCLSILYSGNNTCTVYSCLSQSYRKHKRLTNQEINDYIAIFVLCLQQEVSHIFLRELIKWCLNNWPNAVCGIHLLYICPVLGISVQH